MMKNFLASLVVLSSLASVAAFAEVEAAPSRCDYILKLSDSQKLEIKEITLASAEKLKALAPAIRRAKHEADLVLAKIEASKEEAAAAAQVLLIKSQEVQVIKVAEKLAILFDVLTPEQRLKKVKCEQQPHPRVERRPAPRPHSRPSPGGVVYRPYQPHRPGRIEHRPVPNTRPGRVIVYRPGSRRP